MASHHHHHHSHRESIPLVSASYATSSRCCCGDSSLCCSQTQPNHPLPLSPDHLLRLIASYLQQQQEIRCPERTCSCETLSQRCNGIRRQSFVNQQKNVQREYDKLVLASLLRKIDDLDLSLNRFSASYDERRGSYCTLKDSAARVIQTYFRSYLVGRSQSLRQLKVLATIKSSFMSLKSLVSGKTQFPIGAVSREATDLLLQLVSIQGKLDPLVRNGKRSLSRDLVRFLQYLEGCGAVRRHNFVSKSSKDAGFTGSCDKVKRQGSYAGEDRTTEKVRKQMGRIYVTSNGNEEDCAELEEFHFISDDGEEFSSVSVESRKVGSSKSRNGSLVKGNKVLAPVTKTVKLGKNGNAYQVHGNIHELTSSTEGDDSVDDNKEILMMSRDDGVVNSSRTRSGSGVLIKDSGGKTRVMKTVSFDENGNIYRVYGDTPEASVSGGDDSSTGGSNDENGERDSYNEVEQIKYVPKENEDFKEDEEEEDSSSEGSKERVHATRNDQVGRNDHKRQLQLQKGSLMFSPPLPLKMEP